MKSVFFYAVLSVFISFSPVFSHGDIHERILEVTSEIKKNPDSAYLYFKRGKLFYQHEDYKKSIKDINKSSKLGFIDIEQNLLLSKNYLKLNNYQKALILSESLLKQSPNNVIFLKVKAKSYLGLKKFDAAALAFEEVILHSSKTFPENYIDASNAWLSFSNTEQGITNAIKVLNEGIQKLGSIVSLYEAQISIYCSVEDYSNATLVQYKIIDLLNRKEFAYYRLAQLYKNQGNNEMALESIQNAKLCIQKLPYRLKTSSAILELEKKIESIEVSLIN